MVISSLNAQMYDQIVKLNERGISSCMIQRHRMVSWFTAKEMTLSSYHFLIMKHLTCIKCSIIISCIEQSLFLKLHLVLSTLYS